MLIALLDPAHPFHLAAHAWFARNGAAWASCAITQNGAIRIMSHPRYGNPDASTAVVAGVVADLCRHEGHRFWPCDVSLLDSALVDQRRLGAAAPVTDTYLLALAAQHGGKLATFNRRLVADAVKGGREALQLIG